MKYQLAQTPRFGGIEMSYAFLVDHDLSACLYGGINLLPIKLPFLGTPWNHNEGGKCDFRKPRWVVMTIAPHLSKGSRGWRPKIRPAKKICQLSSWFWAHLSVEVGSWWDWNCSTTWSADPLKLSIRDKAAAVINFTPAVAALDLHTWTLGGLDISGSIGKCMIFRGLWKQSSIKWGVSSQSKLCHFFWLIARILTFRDKTDLYIYISGLLSGSC